MSVIIDGSNGLTFPNSTTQASAGSVLQVVSTTKTDAFSTSSTTVVDITGLSVTITPKFATSKILVQVVVTGGSTDTTGIATIFQLVRGSTSIGQSTVGALSYNGSFSFANRTTGTQNVQTSGVIYLDSPATTSATTYKIQCATSAGTLYVNRDPSASAGEGCTSSITVMEIAA